MSGHHRWRGYSHDELYRKIHTGPGAAASAVSIARWTDMSSVLSDVTSDLHGAVESAGAQWEGVAADGAKAGLGPLGVWADDARVSADVMKLSAELQAEYVSKARADMPNPLPVTAEKPGVVESCVAHLFDIQTDFEKQEAAQSTAEQRAYDVMSTYEASTVDNTSTLGRFTPPPAVTVDSPALTGGTGPQVNSPILGQPHVPALRDNTPGGKPTSGAAGQRRAAAKPRQSAKAPATQTPRPSASRPAGGGPSPAGTTPAPATATSGSSGPAKPAMSAPVPAKPSKPGSATNASSATTSEAATTAQHRADANRPGGQYWPRPNGMSTTSAAATYRPSTHSRRPDAALSEPLGAVGSEPDSAATTPVGAAVPHSRQDDGDQEYRVADYFVRAEDVFGVDHVVAPPVIGEDPVQR